MSVKDYLKDHLIALIIFVLNLLFIASCMLLFKVNAYGVTLVFFIIILSGFVIFFLQYHKANQLFKQLDSLVHCLDQKFIVHEMMEEPDSYEGKLLFQYLCEINTAMINYLNTYKLMIDDFKEYLEIWIHEIKIPLASARLIVENNKSHLSVGMVEELNRIDDFVEQVLFYVRSENVEKDYTVKECYLEDIVKPIIVNHRKSFIYKKIKLELINLHVLVNTDSKWMEFIINQIIANSIKYAKDDNARITISAEETPQQVLLKIEDNGIGIASQDISRVFEKGFTGENGRMKYKSTGIGLYLCKALCEKLHHMIFINSILHEKSVVTIVFPKNMFMDIVK